MAERPRAKTSLSDAVSAAGAGSVIIAVCAPVPGLTEVDATLIGTTDAVLDRHGYCQGAAYSALHFEEPSLPVLFVGLPVATAGAITHLDRSGVTGTSVVSVTAGADGVLEQVDGEMTVTRGGTVGTSFIEVELTLDGGFNARTIRFGTTNSYTVPYFGIVIGLGAGTLAEGDVVTFRSRAPKFDAAGATAVRAALAEDNIQVRTWLFIGDADTETVSAAISAAAEAYATTNDRFARARCQARDLYRPAELVGFRAKTVGAALTFAEVGATSDTITRATGSWTTDGFTNGDTIVVTGAVATAGANNVTGAIASLTGTVITLGSTDLIAEGPITSATVRAYSTLTFDATGDTITRSSGSFLTDGFHVGMEVTIDGTASNDGEYTVEDVSATVLTLQLLTDEVIGAQAVTITAVEDELDWRDDVIEEHEDLSGDAYRRLTIGAGYGSKTCPISGWRLRRPVSWAASLREYGHDVHIADWRVADGPLNGWTLEDPDKKRAEYDDRVVGGLVGANITCFTTHNDEPGAYVALDFTRANPGSMLSRSHNMDVANVACTTVQKATTREIGQVLTLERAQGGQPASGRATETSLSELEGRINKALELNLLREYFPGEGARATNATWKASRDDVLNVVGATMTGVLTLELNGTIEQVRTVVKVPTFGG
jgi:hypothetical protein